MTTFRYKARSSDGTPVEGEMSADSPKAVAERLKEQGKLPVLIKPLREGLKFNFRIPVFQSISFNELNMFTRQLFTLQKAGLPILSSLTALQRQTSNKAFKRVIQKINYDVEAGDFLSVALSRHPTVFNQIYVNMVKTGEATGRLDEALERMAVLGENDENIRQRVKSALRYPLIVVCALCIAFVIVITFVVPKFANLYSKFGSDLPMPTQILLTIHHVVIHYWWAIIAGAAAVIYFLRQSIRAEEGGMIWDRWKLSIPVFGTMILHLAMSRFSRITGILLKSGVPILQTLEIVANGIGNRVIAKTILDIRQGVDQGKSMAEPIEQSGMFPPIVVQMVSVGEQSGRLHELLAHVADYYDGQIDYRIKNLVSLIEPMLIFVLGLGVLLMALGIFLPMWKMMTLFR